MATINVEIYKYFGEKVTGNISLPNRSLAGALEYIKNCINSYNAKLASYKDPLPDEVFAHRFFEMQSIELDSTKTFYNILENSYEYVTRVFSDYEWPSKIRQFQEGAKIALIKNDVYLNTIHESNGVNRRITIYLDLRKIVMSEVFEPYTKEEYLKMSAMEDRHYGISLRSVGNIENINCFHLNALEDILNFVKKNPNGILEENSGDIWIPA